MPTLKTLLVLTFGLLPVAAYAACTTDADCATGEQCLALPCACGAPACDPSAGECTDPEPCTCDETAECVPADTFDDDVYYSDECTADADCPMGFACEEVQVPCASTRVDCACPPCAEGETCEPCDCGEPVDPEPCEATSYKFCAYKPVQCTADADCAEGFACQAEEVCSGGGATNCACAAPACDPDGGECAEPEPCECETDPEPASEPTCEVTGHSCQPKQIECDAAADCPSGWECIGVSAGCACPAIACASTDPDGCPDLPACDCAAEPTVSYCMPGGWAVAAARDYAAGGDENTLGAPQSPTAAFMEDAAKAAADGSTADPAKGSGCSFTTSATAGLGALLVTLLALLGVAVRRVTVLGR